MPCMPLTGYMWHGVEVMHLCCDVHGVQANLVASIFKGKIPTGRKLQEAEAVRTYQPYTLPVFSAGSHNAHATVAT